MISLKSYSNPIATLSWGSDRPIYDTKQHIQCRQNSCLEQWEICEQGICWQSNFSNLQIPQGWQPAPSETLLRASPTVRICQATKPRMVSYSENPPIQRNTLTQSLRRGKPALATLGSACVLVRDHHQASTSSALATQDEQRNTGFHPNRNGILKALEHRSSFSNWPRTKSDSGVQSWF